MSFTTVQENNKAYFLPYVCFLFSLFVQKSHALLEWCCLLAQECILCHDFKQHSPDKVFLLFKEHFIMFPSCSRRTVGCKTVCECYLWLNVLFFENKNFVWLKVLRERYREREKDRRLKKNQDNAILCMKKSVTHNNNNRNNSFSTVLILVYSLSSEGKITLMNEDTHHCKS